MIYKILMIKIFKLCNFLFKITKNVKIIRNFGIKKMLTQLLVVQKLIRIGFLIDFLYIIMYYFKIYIVLSFFFGFWFFIF